MNTGAIILDQIQTMGRQIVWSWGAHNYKAFTQTQLTGLGPHLGGLLFQVNGRLYKGKVFISLSPDDTYKVSFGTLTAGKLKIKHSSDGIFFDQLIGLIDSYVETPTEVTC